MDNREKYVNNIAKSGKRGNNRDKTRQYQEMEFYNCDNSGFGDYGYKILVREK